MLEFRDGVELIERYGLPPLVGTLATTRQDAIERAREIGFPVAIKLISLAHSHKAAAGLVMLNLLGEMELEAATVELLERGGGEGFEGFLVQPMISGGIELFLGALVDPQFGPLVAFGPGGSLVELLGGVDFLRPPFNVRQARVFIERNPVHPLLIHGGAPARVDGNAKAARGDRSALSTVDTLTQALLGMGRLISEQASTVVSVDINPLVVSPRWADPITLDLRVEGGSRDGKN
jgi:succinyl-CoA synthetase beta subunit